MQTIPLAHGAANAHQRFSVQLGGKLIRFEINFLAYLDHPAWCMNLYQGTYELATGVMLEPGSDLLQCYDINIGSLVFIGDPPTLDNLGVNNELVWVGGFNGSQSGVSNA